MFFSFFLFSIIPVPVSGEMYSYAAKRHNQLELFFFFVIVIMSFEEVFFFFFRNGFLWADIDVSTALDVYKTISI